MAYNVKILADSISEHYDRLTTFELTYPRIVHAEYMTHRMLSKNSSSSRAIPIQKMIDNVNNDPFIPVYWGKNQKGMQAKEELTGKDLELAKKNWLKARDEAVKSVEKMVEIGVHKQIANRLLEPWMWITVISTGTDFYNFFKLRCHEDAQPEIKLLADMMYDAYNNNKPQKVKFGEWHLPLTTEEERNTVQSDNLCRISIGRCARVSYLTHDGKRDLQADMDLCDRLINSSHFSPTEHIATPHIMPYREGNFLGWRQYRKKIPGENVNHFVRPY